MILPHVCDLETASFLLSPKLYGVLSDILLDLFLVLLAHDLSIPFLDLILHLGTGKSLLIHIVIVEVYSDVLLQLLAGSLPNLCMLNIVCQLLGPDGQVVELVVTQFLYCKETIDLSAPLGV